MDENLSQKKILKKIGKFSKMEKSKIKTSDFLLSQTLIEVYPILIEKIGKSKIWQILYSIQLSNRNLSKMIPLLIDYALDMVKEQKEMILPPNVLSFLYPNISYSMIKNRWCVPNQKDLERMNYETAFQKPLQISQNEKMVRKILKVKRK